MLPAPVPCRPTTPPEPPSSGGPTLKISASKEPICYLNRPSEVTENPGFTAGLIAPGSCHRLPAIEVPFASSSSGGSPVHISCNLESICPSKSEFEPTPSLFMAISNVQSPIPAICGPVCSIRPSIYAPLSRGKSFHPPISGFRPPLRNALFCNFPPSSTSKPSELVPFPTDSHQVSTGSRLQSPSPTLGGGQLAGQRVDPAESQGQSGRVNSASISARSVAPGVSGGAPVRSVPPTVTFRDILGRGASSRPHLAFPDDGFRSELTASTGEVPVQSVRDGIPGILFPDQLISSLSARFRFALVGRVSGNRRLTPNSDILSALSCTGLLGSHTVQFLPRGYLVLTLSCEEDYMRFWTQPVVSIRSVVIRFSKWTPEFTLEADSSIAPVWVRFPDLPLHLYDRQSLFHIAQLLGHPVQVDQFTADGSKGSYARVCVEIDVLAPRPEQIWVGWGSHVVHLDVVYERVPFYCSECLMLGHSSLRCVRTGYPSAAARAKAQGKRPIVSPSVSPFPTVSQSDVPSGSASLLLEPGWQRQRRRRRPHRRSGPTDSGVGVSRAPDIVVEDIPYESEFPVLGVSPGISGVDLSSVIMRIDSPVVSPTVSAAPPASSVEVLSLPVVDAPTVQVPMDVSLVQGPVVVPQFTFPPSSSELGSGSGCCLPDSVPPPTTGCQSLPLPGRTRSQRRRFYRAQAAQLGSPYGRPPDPDPG